MTKKLERKNSRLVPSLDRVSVVSGEKTCLRCRKVFFSVDVKRNWICLPCHRKPVSVPNMVKTNITRRLGKGPVF